MSFAVQSGRSGEDQIMSARANVPDIEKLGGGPARDGMFAYAFRLLRPRMRADVLTLYRALRSLDDLVDEGRPEAAARVAAVERWCADGSARSPEAKAFSELARKRELRSEPVGQFCQAMRHDLRETPIITQTDFERYCGLVAGSVGVMIAQITGSATPEVERRMIALGTGVQIAHVLRDIDLDRAEGRTFIPREAIKRHGSIEPGARASLIREQIARAEIYFAEAAPVYSMLAEGGRAVAACAALYREILRQVERDGYGARVGPPVVSRRRRYAILARACLTGR